MASDPSNPFSIDPHDLDGEWLIQAKLTRKAGIREADARHDHAQAKARLDVLWGKLWREVLKNPELYDLAEGKKPTEDTIKATIAVQPSYIAAVDAVNDAKRDLDYCSSDTTAFIDRRKTLENLVDLVALEYYSTQEPQAKTPKAHEAMKNVGSRIARRPLPDPDDEG